MKKSTAKMWIKLGGANKMVLKNCKMILKIGV
jgi:hypothetical protein